MQDLNWGVATEALTKVDCLGGMMIKELGLVEFTICWKHILLEVHKVWTFTDVGDFRGSTWRWWGSWKGEERGVCWRIWGGQRPQCMDQVRLNNGGLVMKINFQVGTIDAMAAMGKLVVQSSERINFYWETDFYFFPAGGHIYLIDNHYWLCCVGNAHVSKYKFQDYIST